MTAFASLGSKKLGQDEYANLIAALGQDRDQLARLFARPWKRFEGTTDSNTAAASSPIVSLSDEGILFPANTERLVTVAVMAANGDNRFNFVTQQRVLGGTNPTLVGPEEYLTNCEARLVTALGASGTTTTETAALCKGPAWWDGAAPAVGAFTSGLATAYFLGGTGTPALPCRGIIPLGATFSHATSSIANTRVVGMHNPAVAASSIDLAIADLATPSASAADGTLTARAFVLPPLHAPVLIDTGSSPDEVFIGALGISSDVVTWIVDVFISDPIKLALA
jgi:hypothetical protein